MNSVFLKSSWQQEVPPEYSSGLVLGPIRDKARCGFKHTLDHLLCLPQKPNPIIKSFASLALAVYMADKGYARADTPDSWTRNLTLSVPINDGFLPAIPILSQGLKFLSGDFWQVDARAEQISIGENRYYQDNFTADAICLFSGGTDSLTGAINLLEEGKTIILVSHFESGSDAGIQKHLASYLRSKYSPKLVRHLPLQVCSATTIERTTRARSFLFLALGLMIASAYAENIPVYIPENGFVGINIPLAGSRQGSYSTRTTHPSYISKIQEGLSAVSSGHDIMNPLSGLSKGEVLQSCKNPKLLARLLNKTVSCAKAGWVRWEGYPPGTNCGFCYPCLIRRAAFHSIGLDSPETYLSDAIGTPDVLNADDRGQDLRCLLQAVSRYKRSQRSTLFDVLKSGSIATYGNVSDTVRTVDAGLNEVIALISDKGCSKVKRYAFK